MKAKILTPLLAFTFLLLRNTPCTGNFFENSLFPAFQENSLCGFIGGEWKGINGEPGGKMYWERLGTKQKMGLNKARY
ncbi:MAG: hypothetical protein AB2L24_28705 [Mangrovibacterium sp.]